MNTELIREHMKFHVVIENKNTNGKLRWINDMVAGRMFTMRFMLVSQNLGLNISFPYPYTNSNNNFCTANIR